MALNFPGSPSDGQIYTDTATGSQYVYVGAYGYWSTISPVDTVYDKANTANYYAYLVDSNTSAAFLQANNASLTANSAYDSSNLNQTISIAAYDKANAANLLAYDTGIGANAFTSTTIAGANVISLAAFDKANLASDVANAAFDKANTGATNINAFSRIAVANQSNIDASTSGTLNFAAANGINITTDPASKKITIALGDGFSASDYGSIADVVISSSDYGSL